MPIIESRNGDRRTITNNSDMTLDPDANQLREAVEQMHGGTAQLAQSVPVRETFEGKTVWEGVVRVFDLTGHSTATRAYASSSPIEGSTKRRFFAVLHQPPVDSPQSAVRAAIVAEHRNSDKRPGNRNNG